MKEYISKEYLIKQIKTKTYFQIAKENDVSLSTIFRNPKKFGLTKKGSKGWNKKELKLLKNKYLHNPSIHKLFPNRTKSSVYHKVNRLKFERIIRERKHKVNQYFFKE